MKLSTRLLLTLAAVLAVQGFTRHTYAQAGPRPELRYDLRAAWRLGAPALAYEEFPVAKPDTPGLYLGHNRPRGIVTLRAPGNLAATPASQRRVLRSDTVDLTPQLTLVGAHHQAADSKARWVEVVALPKLHVRYDPDLPARLEVPSQPGTCVLLFEVGEGAEAEWVPGLWTLKLRFDAVPLDVRLAPFALTGTPDPSRPAGTAVIFELQFLAKRVASADDELNVLLFQAAEARTEKDGSPRVLTALDRILTAYPNDGNLRYARAQLLREAGREAEALADAKQVLALGEAGGLRARFVPPTGERTSGAKAMQWLAEEIGEWEKVRR